jgi:hypothetical protein
MKQVCNPIQWNRKKKQMENKIYCTYKHFVEEILKKPIRMNECWQLPLNRQKNVITDQTGK